ncbi:MAG: TIGR02099 family protein, partial [Betaproteobacteria bacterium]|nr:TIGR02099 family protein [Betaproteobacteria bacterium]
VLEWSGGWTDFSLLALKAEAKLDLNDGQFSKIQPGGVGRLISLFSLQTLPRRITLDFRDVFSEGFAFDHLNVDLALDHEKLTTRDFEMAGPAARVSMTGEVDLQQETTQLEAQVEPALGGSVTLASAVVGGPVVGAASWLVQKILGNPFDKALSYDYAIQGPWDAPDIRPVQRP